MPAKKHSFFLELLQSKYFWINFIGGIAFSKALQFLLGG